MSWPWSEELHTASVTTIAVAVVHGTEHCREHAHVRLGPRDDEGVDLALLQVLAEAVACERRVDRLVENLRRRRETGERRHQLEEARVEVLARRLTPMLVVAPPHARRLF